MSWIALSDLSSPAFNIRGIGVPANAPGARPPMAPYEIMPTGTLMFELRYNAEPGAPWSVFRFRRHREWRREMSADFDGNGRLRLAFRQGKAQSHAEIRLPAAPRDSRIRVTYCWHAPQRAGLLTVEMIDEGRMFQAGVTDPLPLPVGDVRALMRNGHASEFSPEIKYIAVSDEIEPVGFGSGVVEQTPVETIDGPVPVERLRLGDMVLTAASGPQPVRWIGKRTTPALGGFRPVRLRAAYFGVENDITVAPAHRIRLDLDEAAYMLGNNDVLIPAAHLANGKLARRDRGRRLVTYYQILLDTHDCLLHDGIWAESLFVGTIAKRPEVAETTVLGGMPTSAIPVHRDFARHRLTDFEARNLAASLQRA